MNPARVRQIDATLAAAGIHYDPSQGLFFRELQQIDPAEVLELFPGMSIDELGSYEAARRTEWWAGR